MKRLLRSYIIEHSELINAVPESLLTIWAQPVSPKSFTKDSEIKSGSLALPSTSHRLFRPSAVMHCAISFQASQLRKAVFSQLNVFSKMITMRCWGDTTDSYNLFKNMGKSDACTATGYQAKAKRRRVTEIKLSARRKHSLTHSLTLTTARRTPSLSFTLCMNVEPPDDWWDAPHQVMVKYLNRILKTHKCKHVLHYIWKILCFEYRQLKQRKLLLNSPHLLQFPLPQTQR